jgi:hypothetical protein
MCDLRWCKYLLPCGRRIYLTNRPDNADGGQVEEFIRVVNPGVRFQFTDDNFPRPKNDPPYHWYVWFAEAKNPHIDVVYSAISMIGRCNKELPASQALWMHCDSSSMRAPTFFGLFLYANYNPDIVKSICDGVTINKEREYISRPDEYATVSFKLQPETKVLTDRWNNAGEWFAWRYLGELHRGEK